MKAICTILLEKDIWQWNKEVRNNTLDTVLPDASTIIGLPGRATSHIANTTTGKIALGTIAGLVAARALAKKYQEKNTKDNLSDPTVSKQSVKKTTEEPDWVKKGKINEDIIIYQEQNENLPRFPMLSYTQKIRPSSRSIASFFLKRKPNQYDTNAESDNIETSRKIAAKNIKDTEADTGVDRVIGKLAA
jgi:hypothetical protein